MYCFPNGWWLTAFLMLLFTGSLAIGILINIWRNERHGMNKSER